MNPPTWRSSPAMASSDVSLIALFIQGPLGRESGHARPARLLGLGWAIAIDKIFLYSRTKRAMDRF